MNKYEIIQGDDKDGTRIEMRFRREELNSIVEELTQVYPGFREWVESPNNRFFFREVVNVAINRYSNQLTETDDTIAKTAFDYFNDHPASPPQAITKSN